jgi:hypothetical protein
MTLSASRLHPPGPGGTASGSRAGRAAHGVRMTSPAPRAAARTSEGESR